MDKEQVKTTLLWFISNFGAGIAGFVVGKQWLTAQQAAEAIRLLSDPAIVSVIASIAVGIYTFIKSSKSNQVATVNAMPEVKGVITKDTKEGKALAESVPSESVQAAGTVQAAAITKGGAK